MIFYYFNYNVIWASIISGIVGAAVVLAFFLLKNKGGKTADDMKPSAKKDLILGFRDNAEAFSDLYEPLFILASGNTSRKDFVLDSMLERVKSLEGCISFKKAYEEKFDKVASFKGKNKKYIKCADSIIKYIYKAGIERDDDITVTADNETAEKYDIIGNASITADKTYDVFIPYWSIETVETVDEKEIEIEKILSKGAIR